MQRRKHTSNDIFLNIQQVNGESIKRGLGILTNFSSKLLFLPLLSETFNPKLQTTVPDRVQIKNSTFISFFIMWKNISCPSGIILCIKNDLIRIRENPASMENDAFLERSSTGNLIVGRKINKGDITWTNFLWVLYSV